MRVSRRSFVSACSLVGAAVGAEGSATNNAFVRVHGTKLIAPNKEKLLLRGINLGNWFVQEGYMFLFEGGPQSPREIEAFFNELIGPAAAQAFWTEYRRNYITAADIAFIRKSGLNSVRVPLHFKYFVGSDEGFKILDPIVAACRENGLWVIFDLHCAPGGQTGTNIDDSWGYPWLYEDEAAQRSTVDFWARIAQHYSEEPAVLGYDLLNEANPQFPNTPKYNPVVAALYKRMIATIRQVDRNHIIVLGGVQWDTNFTIFDSRFDSKVMYSFHVYGITPSEATIKPYVDFADQNDAPLFMGESGENTDEWIAQFVRVLENDHVNWCFWPYKKIENPRCMVSIEKPQYWDEVVALARRPSGTANAAARIAERLSLEHSRAAAQRLLDNLALDKCRINNGYLQALGLMTAAKS